MAPFKPDPFGANIVDHRSVTMVDPTQKLKLRDASSPGAIKKVVFHCTDAAGWSPERLGRFFVEERKFPICGYHYYVTKDAVFQMVGENVITYHSAGYNTLSVAFSIDYNPTIADKLNQLPPFEEMEKARRIAAHLCLKFKVPPTRGNLVGHRELKGTGWIPDKNDRPQLRKTCPGLRINLDEFRYEVARYLQEYLKTNDEEMVVDGIWGPRSQKALEVA